MMSGANSEAFDAWFNSHKRYVSIDSAVAAIMKNTWRACEETTAFRIASLEGSLNLILHELSTVHVDDGENWKRVLKARVIAAGALYESGANS